MRDREEQVGSQPITEHTIGVKELCDEFNIGRLIGVVLREFQLEFEGAPLPRCAIGAEMVEGT